MDPAVETFGAVSAWVLPRILPSNPSLGVRAPVRVVLATNS